MGKEKDASKKLQTVGTCLECGVWVEYLPTHLKYSHQGMSMQEYTAKHGKGARVGGAAKVRGGVVK